ncbi:Adenylyl-sulfate kinase (APS kinase) (ATP adenosine-5'-phosphosulfate 3'-phosphotransferase) (Adenosine-5'-phosphosulfate kinase), partial [Durusdinium trenchii]
DRAENIRRVGEVAALLADAGLIVITAFISPYRADRERAREAAGDAFREVFIDADVATCESRDPKGLYKRARAGEIAEFTGISAPYEEPAEPDIRVDTSGRGVEECLDELLKIGPKRVDAVVEQIERVIDIDALSDHDASRVARDEIADVVIRTNQLVAFDNHEDLAGTGRIIFVDRHLTLGGGVLSLGNYPDQRQLVTVRGTNLTEVDHRVEPDRAENIRRVGEVAALLADAGLIVITAFISPYRADRERAREAAGDAFREVFIDADVATCESRDPKGLYKRARAGEIAEFTGISAPYEEPAEPDIRVDTSGRGVEECLDELVAYVTENFSNPR